MTMAKAVIRTIPTGIEVRVGWDEEMATQEEKDLAIEIGSVINEYMKLKAKAQRKEGAER